MKALEIPLDCSSEQEAPPILLEVFDQDKGVFSDSSQFLGRATIFMKDYSRSHEIPKPKWYDFKFGIEKNSPSCGQVLCSFTFVPEDTVLQPAIQQINLHEQIQTKRYKVEIDVLGLRALESTGFLPVQKAFIKFNVKSLLPAEDGFHLGNIFTAPD